VIQKFAVVLAISVCMSSELVSQQQSRAQLLRNATTAYDDFQPDRALDFLRSAVDPSLGAPDTAWTRGVHLLAQILVEGNKPDLARTWARWAVRTLPGMTIDTVNFLAGVTAAMREAQTFTSTKTPGDALTQTSWRWPARGTTEANGRVAINQGTMTATVNARIVGGGLIPTGTQGISLPPGTYEIEAAAVGYLPARVSREVLPGVTTALTMALTPVAVAIADITDELRQHTFANVVPLTVHRYGIAPACAAGAFVGRDGLAITSYQAIRGADSIAAGIAGAPRVTVAAYDVPMDIAILRAGAQRTDSIALATAVADGQSLWGVRLADCRTPSDARTRVVQWTNRPSGPLQIADAATGAPTGAVFVDRDGRLAAVWTSGTGAVPAPRFATLLEQARQNAAQSLAVADVSRRENHLFGTAAIASDAANATITVSPLETWQWEALAASGPAPLSFVGAMGRYRVQASTPAGTRQEQVITIRPNANQRFVISTRAVAAGPEAAAAVTPKKKSKLPWIIGGVGGVAVLGAVALGGGGGGGGNGGNGGNGGGSGPGRISIQVPVNPP
jgi:hypothetical protein